MADLRARTATAQRLRQSKIECLQTPTISDSIALQYPLCQMKRAFDNVLNQLQAGEELIAAGVDQLSRRWQASATCIGKLCTETDRWQAALRRMQAPLRQMQNPVDLAKILRARTVP